MGNDPALRVLLALILVSLLLLVAQGFKGGGEAQGPYRVSVIKSNKPWLMRVNSDTGQVDRLVLKGAGEWVALGEKSLDLAELEAAEVQDESDEAPSVPDASASSPARELAADTPLEVAADTEIEALFAALEPRNPSEIRVWAAGILGSYVEEAPERSVPALIGALDDPDPLVVAAAARSLGKSDQPAALSALRPLEDHPDAEVQAAAREAVARLE